MRYPEAIQSLIEKLSDLPSVGPKTAERYVFYLLKQNPEKLKNLALAISELLDKIKICPSCLMISAAIPCSICADNARQPDSLCIVENTQNILSLEATKQYNGRYFVLGGLIDTINGVGPADLNIDKLVRKIKNENIKELIIALNFTLEGETTALYLTKILGEKIKISRLAKGLPAGSNLEYADELTLGSALKYRNKLN
ncbi:MAG: recombination mediator RecR [Patescibacteria group bacterium]